MDALLLCAVITISSDDESETPPVKAAATSTSVVAATPVKSKSFSRVLSFFFFDGSATTAAQLKLFALASTSCCASFKHYANKAKQNVLRLFVLLPSTRVCVNATAAEAVRLRVACDMILSACTPLIIKK